MELMELEHICLTNFLSSRAAIMADRDIFLMCFNSPLHECKTIAVWVHDKSI